MIPASLQANPSLDRWVGFESDGWVRVAFGKVETGQGAITGIAQIAAEELDVGMDRLVVTNAATPVSPDEGMTVGSMSTETSGAAVRAACAEVRALFLAEASRRLGCSPVDLDVLDGAILRDGEDTGETYWTLAPHVDLARPATGEARWKSPDKHRVVGRSVPRLDLPPKLFGGGFMQDLIFPDALHARVLRQPGPTARLTSLDEGAVRRAAGEAGVDILVDGAFVAFISTSEAAAAAALATAELAVQWDDARHFDPAVSEPVSLKAMTSLDVDVGAPAPEPSNRRRLQAAYSRPYIAHGSMAPSAGVGRFEDGVLKVWTHGQGVYPLRGMLARITGLAPEAIEVTHVQGAGCYGHNGADDAAADAAVIAQRRPGKTIRVQWRREDEFGFAPVGAAMHIELTGELDADGRLADWTSEIWSPPHVGRGRALVETALTGQNPPSAAPDPAILQRFSGGRLNGLPSYDIPASRIREHLVTGSPVRTSSLRGLGGPVNIYACESFVDELADAAGKDPLAFRLEMLSDPRGRAVLERCAEMADWSRRWAAGSGRGLGISYDRHRDRGAYCAVASLVSVEQEVRLEHIWCVTDCGLVINPDGAINQIEGAIVMSASWALKEQVRLDGPGVASVTWGDYPILRFDEVPPVDVALINHPEAPALGLGEISQGGAMASIGNAVAHALGARVRALPFTRERLAQGLLAGEG